MTGSSHCPNCVSRLLEPHRFQPSDGADVTVDLRCAECGTWTEARFTRPELEELDRLRAAAREELVNAYERCVSESMEALARCLAVALEQDLVGPDDFAPRRAPLPPRPHAAARLGSR